MLSSALKEFRHMRAFYRRFSFRTYPGYYYSGENPADRVLPRLN